MREKVRASDPVETEEQLARLGLLTELLERPGAEYYMGEEEDRELTTLIDFLCTDGYRHFLFYYLCGPRACTKYKAMLFHQTAYF